MDLGMDRKYFAALTLCLGVILLIVIVVKQQSFHNSTEIATARWDVVTLKHRPFTPVPQTVTFESHFESHFKSHSVIRSTEESLYDMYGEGNSREFDGHLLNYIRSQMSRQGPGGRRLSSKSSRVYFTTQGGDQFVDKLLKQRQNGFFVECGAMGGEKYSDTLFFEIKRNWTGLLIEAHPDYHREILKKNRRALVLRGCLGSSRRPALVKFKLAGWGSGVSALNKNEDTWKNTTPETHVQCFSLNSVMAAIGVRHIDLMVLDVEGGELPILETIDWTRLSVDVFIIEYRDKNQIIKLEKIRQFFKRVGNYKEVGKLPVGSKDDTALDVIVARV